MRKPDPARSETCATRRQHQILGGERAVLDGPPPRGRARDYDQDGGAIQDVEIWIIPQLVKSVECEVLRLCS